MKDLKILWHSNSPLVPSGYGNQTALFIPKLARDFTPQISAFWGHRGTPIKMGEVRMVGGGIDGYGNDVLPTHRNYYKPDVIFTLIDVRVFGAGTLDAIGDIAAMWCPVEWGTRLIDVTRNVLQLIRWPVAMSRFGYRVMKEAGLHQATYIPHGVDTTVFKPIDRGECRDKLGWSGRFVAMVNGSNREERKNLTTIVQAWRDFLADEPTALLYIHTAINDPSGVDLLKCADYYGLTVAQPLGTYPLAEANIQFVDPYRYATCLITWDELNQLYNAADVLLSPSRAEGFGIPVIESQAAGCPVVVSDFSAQTELVGPGHAIKPAWLGYSDIGGEYAVIAPGAILRALRWAKTHQGETLRRASREFAMQYDAETVYQTYMKPFFLNIAAEKIQRALRTEQRLLLRANKIPTPNPSPLRSEGKKDYAKAGD